MHVRDEPIHHHPERHAAGHADDDGDERVLVQHVPHAEPHERGVGRPQHHGHRVDHHEAAPREGGGAGGHVHRDAPQRHEARGDDEHRAAARQRPRGGLQGLRPARPAQEGHAVQRQAASDGEGHLVPEERAGRRHGHDEPQRRPGARGAQRRHGDDDRLARQWREEPVEEGQQGEDDEDPGSVCQGENGVLELAHEPLTRRGAPGPPTPGGRPPRPRAPGSGPRP